MGKIHLESHIDFKLALQALANLTRSYKLSFAPGKWRIIDEKIERDGRRIDGYSRQRLRMFVRRDCLADVNIGKSREHNDIACLCFRRLHAFQSIECEKFGDFSTARFATGFFYEQGT